MSRSQNWIWAHWCALTWSWAWTSVLGRMIGTCQASRCGVKNRSQCSCSWLYQTHAGLPTVPLSCHFKIPSACSNYLRPWLLQSSTLGPSIHRWFKKTGKQKPHKTFETEGNLQQETSLKVIEKGKLEGSICITFLKLWKTLSENRVEMRAGSLFWEEERERKPSLKKGFPAPLRNLNGTVPENKQSVWPKSEKKTRKQ